MFCHCSQRNIKEKTVILLPYLYIRHAEVLGVFSSSWNIGTFFHRKFSTIGNQEKIRLQVLSIPDVGLNFLNISSGICDEDVIMLCCRCWKEIILIHHFYMEPIIQLLGKFHFGNPQIFKINNLFYLCCMSFYVMAWIIYLQFTCVPIWLFFLNFPNTPVLLLPLF